MFTTNIDLNKELANAKSPYDEKSKEKVDKHKKSMAELNSSIEDLTVTTGERLIPMITYLTNFLNDTVIPAINGTLGAIEGLGKSFGLWGVDVMERVVDLHNAVADTFVGKLMGLTPIDKAGIDNLRAMISGTFQGPRATTEKVRSEERRVGKEC